MSTLRFCSGTTEHKIDMQIRQEICSNVIFLPTEHQGVHNNLFRNVRAFQG